MPSTSDPDVLALNRAWMGQQLLRGIAHDCRNHLQILALAVGGPDGGPIGLGTRLDHAIDGMTAALDLLSELGRSDGAESRPTGVAAALERLPVLADLQRNYPARPVTVSGSIEPGAKVDLSAGELIQLLLNVVAAAKAGTEDPTGPVTLAVRAEGADVVFGFLDAGLATWLEPTDRGAPPGIEAVAAGATHQLIERATGRWVATAGGGVDLILPFTVRG